MELEFDLEIYTSFEPCPLSIFRELETDHVTNDGVRPGVGVIEYLALLEQGTIAGPDIVGMDDDFT